jgi:hypothetical protein
MGDAKQIQLSVSSRGMVDYFYCYVCGEYVWDCVNLTDGRLAGAERFFAQELSPLEGFGQLRNLEVIHRKRMRFGLRSQREAAPSEDACATACRRAGGLMEFRDAGPWAWMRCACATVTVCGAL